MKAIEIPLRSSMGIMWCLYDLTPSSWERKRLSLFQFSLRDQVINCLECLPADLTPLTRISLLVSLLKSFHREELLTSKRHLDVPTTSRQTIAQSAGGKLRDKNAKESLALLEDVALYDNESWNNPRDFAKTVKAISLPQDVPNVSDRRLVKLENQVQRLIEAHLAPNLPVQVKKIASSYEIFSGPRDTQYCMETPEQAFVDYASSHTDKARGEWFSFKLEQNNLGDTYNPSWRSHPNLSEMTNKIDTFLKAINDRITGALPSDMVKNPKLNVNHTSSVLSTCSYPMEDPQSSSNSFKSVNAIKMCFKSTFDIQKDQLQVKTLTVKEVKTPKSNEPEKALEDEFKDLHLNLPILEAESHGTPPFDTLADLGSCVNLIPLNLFKNLKIGLLEETKDVLGLADGTKSYPVGIEKNVEVHVGKLKLVEDFHVVDMGKDPTGPLLVERGFLATASAVIDYKKAKIAVEEGITRLRFMKVFLRGIISGWPIRVLVSPEIIEDTEPYLFKFIRFRDQALLVSDPKGGHQIGINSTFFSLITIALS
uniref:MAK10-like protein n=1 Tax=Tanacetum cinerariifolium TaxID=118510 RepID=A0A6L2JVV9_TANCI|nr:MAK10-like protein [Tanacetum cinerariifolium]